MPLVACGRLKLTDSNTKLFKQNGASDWSNFPRHIQSDLDNGLLLQQFVLKARV